MEDLVITKTEFAKMLYEFHFTNILELESIFALQEVFILHIYFFRKKISPLPASYCQSETQFSNINLTLLRFHFLAFGQNLLSDILAKEEF